MWLLELCLKLWVAGPEHVHRLGTAMCIAVAHACFLSEQDVFSTGCQESAHVHHCLSFPQIQFCKQPWCALLVHSNPGRRHLHLGILLWRNHKPPDKWSSMALSGRLDVCDNDFQSWPLRCRYWAKAPFHRTRYRMTTPWTHQPWYETSSDVSNRSREFHTSWAVVAALFCLAPALFRKG